MSWQTHRGALGRIAWSAKAAKVVGADMALFLAVCAHLTAEAGGPFVRFVRGDRPRWDDLLPWNRRKLSEHIHQVFVQDPVEGDDDALNLIREHAYREGSRSRPVYHFESPQVLQAYDSLVFPRETAGDVITMGDAWWAGPVEQWVTEFVLWLRASGNGNDFSAARLESGIYITLEELYRDTQLGVMQCPSDIRAFWRSWFVRRYSDKETSGFKRNMLHYDVFWGDMRRIAGIRDLRPNARVSAKEAYTLASRTKLLLKSIAKAGLTPEQFLRMIVQWSSRTRSPLTLQTILTPPKQVLQ